MIRTITVIAAAAALAAAAPASAQPRNFSSHSAEFFRQFLGGRVFLTNHSGPYHDILRAFHLHPSGDAAYCLIARNNKHDTTHPRTRPDRRWRILDLFQAQFRVWRGEEPNGPRGRFPIFYDPDSGRVHTESYRRTGPGAPRWEPHFDGWVQETWPRAMADACPDIKPPLPVNEAQTARRFARLKAQDPSAPIRDFPGSELAAPGATGLAASGGEPTVSKEKIAAFLRANHGMVLVDPSARRRVLVLLDGHEELWAIGADDSIHNVGHFEMSADGETTGFRWETGEGPKWAYRTYRIGYPFPFTPTGERYAAFRFGDWLAERPRVSLPYMDRQVDFRFKPDGTLEASRTDGGTAPGTWRWSRGSLEIRLQGVEDVATYEWQALAKRVGWPPPEKGG